MPENAHKPRVLVADDERVIADTLAMILNQSGFQARVAYTGEKALELAAEFQPEMLISDVIMAGLNGIDAAIKIREILPGSRFCCFPGRRLRPICWRRRGRRGMSLRFWPSRCTRRICWRK
jgi:CheY-like chemotaxis protein